VHPENINYHPENINYIPPSQQQQPQQTSNSLEEFNKRMKNIKEGL